MTSTADRARQLGARLTQGWQALTRHQWPTRVDAEAWYAASTLAELGALVARWLEGDLASQPGYCPGCGPDPETVPLVRSLAAANRAGFVTGGSQPGESGTGYDGQFWQQRAAVTGFADDATWCSLWPVLDRFGAVDVTDQTDTGFPHAPGARLLVVARRARPRRRHEYGTTVTVAGDSPHTDFGAPFSDRAIVDMYGDMCSGDAIDALCEAWQVTIIDPVWGESQTLWQALDAWTGQDTPDTPGGCPE